MPQGSLLFVNPPGPRYLYRGTICTYLSKARYVWKPKDFLLASARVPADWEIRFLDASIAGLSAEEALSRARSAPVDRVLVALSSISWQGDLAFLERLREAFPKAHLTVFGEVLLEPDYLSRARRFADAALFNPVQYDVASGDFPALPEAPRKGGDRAALGMPRHELFRNWRYRWPFNRRLHYAAVYTQYGCPYSCSYCTESITSVFYRDADEVLEELRRVRRLGYREIHMGDASFGFPKPNAARILEGMIRERMGFSWSCYTYPGLVDREAAERMKRAGCHTVVIGIDSADFQMLAQYGRRLSRDRLLAFLADCRDLQIDVCGDLILGFDEDTEESIRRTLAFAMELDLAYVSINIATPLFGSSIRRRAQAAERLAGRSDGFDTAGNRVLGNGKLGPERLKAFRHEANQAFYGRPSYLWRRLRSIRGPQHLLVQALEASALAENYFRRVLGTNANYRPVE